jgi:hypothetical protein
LAAGDGIKLIVSQDRHVAAAHVLQLVRFQFPAQRAAVVQLGFHAFSLSLWVRSMGCSIDLETKMQIVSQIAVTAVTAKSDQTRAFFGNRAHGPLDGQEIGR